MTHNRLAANRLAANRLAATKLAGSKLATSRATAPGCSPSASACSGSTSCFCASNESAGLLSTADGREVFTYIISCALPGGTTIVGTVGATEYQFFGELGLTPRWIDHRLDKKGQGWISACLFARVNNHDVPVPISVRGDNAALALDSGEAANWTVEEGAFYGQYFTPDGEAINWIACRGRDNSGAVNANRDCAAPDPNDPTHTLCGFKFAGDCADFTPDTPSPFACKTFGPGGFYGTCHDQPGINKWPHAKTFKQVITTFVHP